MESLVGNQREGLFFIVSAPAGTGKTTLVEMLIQEFPQHIVGSISYTTRQPREGEIDGKHYHFITQSEFEAKISASDFLEYVKLYGYYYGTSRQWILDQQKQGKHVILVIDTQGALQLKKCLDATFIFISPPSLEVLKDRLSKRKTETPEILEERLRWAKIEMATAYAYDYLIINDNLQIAYQILRSIIIAENHRTINKNHQ